MLYKNKRYFWILYALYVINDLFYMNMTGYLAWMIVDYSVRIVTIVTLFILYKEYIIDKKMFYVGMYPFNKTVGVGLAFAVAGVIIFSLIEANLGRINFYEGTKFPEITQPFVYWFDMTFGLLLVSISEELLFHAYFYALFKERFSSGQMIVFSAILFAAIHWSNNMTNILGVFIWGILAMQIFIKTKSIWPLVVAHTVTNFVLFREVIDESYFKWWF